MGKHVYKLNVYYSLPYVHIIIVALGNMCYRYLSLVLGIEFRVLWGGVLDDLLPSCNPSCVVFFLSVSTDIFKFP